MYFWCILQDLLPKVCSKSACLSRAIIVQGDFDDFVISRQFMTFLCSEGKNISLTSCKEKRGTFIFLFKCYETFYFNVFCYKLSFSIIPEGLSSVK